MRLRSQKQLYFKVQSESVDGASQLQAIGENLEKLPGYELILSKVQEDLNPQGSSRFAS